MAAAATAAAVMLLLAAAVGASEPSLTPILMDLVSTQQQQQRSYFNYGFAYEFSLQSFLSLPDSYFMKNWTEFSFALWMKPWTVATQRSGVIGALVWDNPYNFHGNAGLLLDEGNLLFVSGKCWESDLSGVTQALVSFSDWNHVVATYSVSDNGGTAKLYVNGSLMSSVSECGEVPVLNYPFTVGRNRYTTRHTYDARFSGQMDEISVWDHALTDDEVTSLMTRQLSPGEKGLLLYYTAELDNMTAAKDVSGNGRDARFMEGEDASTSGLANYSHLTFAVNCIRMRGSKFPSCLPGSGDSVCGDGVITGQERCDGGPGCTLQCRCRDGWYPYPETMGCKPLSPWKCNNSEMLACGLKLAKCEDCECIYQDGVTCISMLGCSIVDVPVDALDPITAVCQATCGTICPEPYPDQCRIKPVEDECRASPNCYWCGTSCYSTPLNCRPVCGNGILDPLEACDMGLSAHPGCSLDCSRVTPGWACEDLDNCTTVCGDGIVAGDELCDTGAEPGCSKCVPDPGYICSQSFENISCFGLEICSVQTSHCVCNSTVCRKSRNNSALIAVAVAVGGFMTGFSVVSIISVGLFCRRQGQEDPKPYNKPIESTSASVTVEVVESSETSLLAPSLSRPPSSTGGVTLPYSSDLKTNIFFFNVPLAPLSDEPMSLWTRSSSTASIPPPFSSTTSSAVLAN